MNNHGLYMTSETPVTLLNECLSESKPSWEIIMFLHGIVEMNGHTDF